MQLFNPIRRLFAGPTASTSIQPYRASVSKRAIDDGDIIAWQLAPSGRIMPIKQGSGMYGSGVPTGFGQGAFTETAIGAGVALTQSNFGWAAAYSVSTWVYRCIEIRKQAVNRMPWHIYNKRTGRAIPGHPLEVALKRRGAQKPFKKLEQTQLLFGESFFAPLKNRYGYYSDLRWLNNLGMAVIIGSGEIMSYSYTQMQGGMAQTYDYDEVAFMKTDNPFNDLRGMSPTEVILDEIAIDKDVARIVRAYYANDTRVGLLLIPKHNLTVPDRERFLETWKMQNQGPNKAGKPVLMPYDMSVERVQNPVTLDDMSLRESTRREIAAGYGVPLSLAGGWDDAKYQSLPEQRKSFYEDTIIPECENISDFINDDLLEYYEDRPGSTEFKFDFTVVLALTEDAQRKGDMYSQRLTSGGITRAEYRRALGHSTKPEDEVYYIPSGVTIVPANEAVLVTPTANQVQDGPSDPTAIQLPKPPAPSGPPGGEQAKPPEDKPAEKPDQPAQETRTNAFSARPSSAMQQMVAVSKKASQATVEDELRAWEKKALNTNALKAAGFICEHIDPSMQAIIRGTLTRLGKDASKDQIRALFKSVKDWSEGEHPRATDGRFGSVAGSHERHDDTEGSRGHEGNQGREMIDPANPADAKQPEFSDAPPPQVDYANEVGNGGSYRNLAAQRRPGEEVHHMPSAESSSSLHMLNGPAVTMPKSDHIMTASYGRSRSAQEYRKKQHELIVAGKFEEAQQMDIDDLRAKFGNKYDKSIKEMQEYSKTLSMSKRSGMPMNPTANQIGQERKRHERVRGGS